jgi:hypothetical protein
MAGFLYKKHRVSGRCMRGSEVLVTRAVGGIVDEWKAAGCCDIPRIENMRDGLIPCLL